MAAKEFSKKVKKMKGVEKIILFGSVAKRKERLTSDVDIAVMVQRKNKDLEREITRITERILEKSRMKIVPIILTSKELEDNEQFSRELKEGEILYERTKRS
ncbi:MAG: nucleotidyltransferase domain-containing protein [Candidatus Hydrothermarchaeota archaeon]